MLYAKIALRGATTITHRCLARMAQLSDAPPLRCTLMFEQRTRRWGVANELHSTAIVEPKVMMPIGDGLRLATGIYFVSRTDNSTSNIAAQSYTDPWHIRCSPSVDCEGTRSRPMLATTM